MSHISIVIVLIFLAFGCIATSKETPNGGDGPKISDFPVTGEDAQDFANLDLAKQKNDSSYCDKVKNEGYQSQCYHPFIDRDLSFCEKMVHFSAAYCDCYAKVAANTKNETLCDRIESECSARDKFSEHSCYSEVAFTKNNLTLCAKINYPREQQSCFNLLAVLTPSLCGNETMFPDDKGDECYRNIAEGQCLSGGECNPPLCGNILEIGMRDDCYSEIARKTGNKSLCEKITNGSPEQSSCYTRIQ